MTPRLPRDLSGTELIRALERQGYVVTRSVGSHVRLTHPGPPERHLTIPRHDELKVGTLKAILDDLGEAWKLDRIQVLQRLLKR
jgi:predicted RNA binding protein YcfA (HicA-like mRNA interferase family)